MSRNMMFLLPVVCRVGFENRQNFCNNFSDDIDEDLAGQIKKRITPWDTCIIKYVLCYRSKVNVSYQSVCLYTSSEILNFTSGLVVTVSYRKNVGRLVFETIFFQQNCTKVQFYLVCINKSFGILSNLMTKTEKGSKTWA